MFHLKHQQNIRNKNVNLVFHYQRKNSPSLLSVLNVITYYLFQINIVKRVSVLEVNKLWKQNKDLKSVPGKVKNLCFIVLQDNLISRNIIS